MTTRDNGLLWLEIEENTAYSEYENAEATERANGYTIEDTMERKYWEGYHNAVINAMAALYGPTPLPGEDGE
jgi:hypothetical protein